MRHYEILTKWCFFQFFSKKWWLFKILGTIWKIIIFSKILKNNHFFSQNWEKSSFYAKILKKSSFLPKILKKHHFFTKIWKNYHFYQSLIVSHKYPILVSNILVSNSIQYWYQILACLLPYSQKSGSWYIKGAVFGLKLYFSDSEYCFKKGDVYTTWHDKFSTFWAKAHRKCINMLNNLCRNQQE